MRRTNVVDVTAPLWPAIREAEQRLIEALDQKGLSQS